MEPVTLAPELDSTALISFESALSLAAASADDGGSAAELVPTTIFVRAMDSYVEATRDLLARTANPAAATNVKVSRPSETLEARAATDSSLRALSLGLGVVGLVVGGVGIANVMVIAVLERRREIGVRRALGATRSDIQGQFLGESMVLAAFGGLLGAMLGAGAANLYALGQGWGLVIPWSAMGLGIGASVLIGAVAGAYPASRAAKISPTEALRSS